MSRRSERSEVLGATSTAAAAALSPSFKRPRKIQVWLDEEVHRVLSMRSAHDGRSMGDIVNVALREWLRNQPPMKPLPTL